jgi:beta-galactosidase GanA
MNKPLPKLVRTGEVTQLQVDGNPFLVIGGELGNSTSSCLKTLGPALEKCRAMYLNSIMLPVCWDLMEPVEGEFDFSLLRGALNLARSLGLRLVPLWFGTWKNCMSCYVPSWVKRDTARFTRVRTANGEPQEMISPECDAASQADARAFAAMMRWLREYDSNHQTVIMVQVENEIGMIPQPRDHSPQAAVAFAQAVPEVLVNLASSNLLGAEVGALWEQAGRKKQGSWGEVFGSTALGEEVFAAWRFATYVQKVLAAGRREYPLPMFVNAALLRPGYQPGQYASGGPLPHLLEVWRAGCPELDMLCPDIYFPNFIEWAQKYLRNGNPLFIPEMAATSRASGNAVYAVGRLGAIGFGPFAIEDAEAEKHRMLTECFQLIAGMQDLILRAQATNSITAISPQVNVDWSPVASRLWSQLGGIHFHAEFDRPDGAGDIGATELPTLGSGRWEAPPGVPLGAVLIIQLAAEEFVALGMGVKLTFQPANGVGKIGLDRVQEGIYTADGNWTGGRWLNGDQTHQGRHIHFHDGSWSVQRFSLYRY